jgi:hypothetical protein
MRINSAFASLFCALSLHLSEPRRSRKVQVLSQLLALVVTLLTAAVLYEYIFHLSLGIDSLLAFDHGTTVRFSGRMSPPTACGLFFLGVAILPIQSRNRFGRLTADLLVSWLCLVTLVLVSGQVFDAMQMFGISSNAVQSSPLTLFCLILLTLVAVLRRAENGIFSILLGRGIGSRIARSIAPILLVLSFLREIGRNRLVMNFRLPENYVSAAIASVATVVSFLILLLLTWRIQRMEAEISDLSLRDELTGVRNLRGFHLLGEQALHLAQRSKQPLSVLFIDLDNLKDINDTLGHNTGSAFLVEMAKLLEITFRLHTYAIPLYIYTSAAATTASRAFPLPEIAGNRKQRQGGDEVSKAQRDTGSGGQLPGLNQDELRRKLRRRGFEVTQATLSRDIHELRLSKGPGGYSLPNGNGNGSSAAVIEDDGPPSVAEMIESFGLRAARP